MVLDPHERFREDVAAYAVGALDRSAYGPLEAHLRGCLECLDLLAEYEEVEALLPFGLEPQAPPAAAWAGLQDRLRAARRRTLLPGMRLPRVNIGPRLLAFTLGGPAVLALLILVAILSADRGAVPAPAGLARSDGRGQQQVAQPRAGGEVATVAGGATPGIVPSDRAAASPTPGERTPAPTATETSPSPSPSVAPASPTATAAAPVATAPVETQQTPSALVAAPPTREATPPPSESTGISPAPVPTLPALLPGERPAPVPATATAVPATPPPTAAAIAQAQPTPTPLPQTAPASSPTARGGVQTFAAPTPTATAAAGISPAATPNPATAALAPQPTPCASPSAVVAVAPDSSATPAPPPCATPTPARTP
jgi:hypothetical protein